MAYLPLISADTAVDLPNRERVQAISGGATHCTRPANSTCAFHFPACLAIAINPALALGFLCPLAVRRPCSSPARIAASPGASSPCQQEIGNPLQRIGLRTLAPVHGNHLRGCFYLICIGG